MKQSVMSKLKALPRLRNVLLLSGVFTFQSATHAQVLIPCLSSDLTYSTLTTQPYMLNADMVEIPGSRLQVAAWDNYGTYPSSGVSIKVIDKNMGYTATLFTPAHVEAQPDIVWARDPNNASIYIIGMVFIDNNGFVNFNTYKVTNVGSATMAIGLNTNVILTGTRGFFPHIDMLPDFDIPMGGLPSLHRFAITYSTMTSTGIYDVRELHGDITAPTTFSPITSISTASNYSAGADIALSYDPVTKREHMYVTYSNGLDIKLSELVTNYLSGPLAPATIVSTTTIMSSGTNFLPYPRIEAMGNYVVSSGAKVPWVIAAPINGSIWAYDIYGSYNASVGVGSTFYNQCPAVTAGPGNPAGNLCNDNYNIGWHNQRYGYMTQVIDAATGIVSTTYPDYYQANSVPVIFPGGTSKVPIALSSCSNSGNGLLTVFWDGGTNMKYHTKDGISGYKPGHTTGVGNVANNSTIKVYPNPASDKLNITGLKTGTYSIINIVGQTVKTGIIDKDNFEINVASFVNGNYILSIRNEEGNQMVPFVKQ